MSSKLIVSISLSLFHKKAMSSKNIKQCTCRKPPRYVPYKGTYVPYDGTYGTPDHGQTLDVQEGQTAESALRDDWTRNVPHHTLEVVLEVTFKHMCNPGSRSKGSLYLGVSTERKI